MALATAGCQLGTPSVGAPPRSDLLEPPAPDLWAPPPPPDLVTLPDLVPPPDLTPPPDFARPAEPAVPGEFTDTNLAARKIDYGLALRTASLKLVGDLPTLDEQAALANDKNPDTFYQKRITAYLADPRFARQMVALFRNVFRAGGTGGGGLPVNLDFAANYAAQLVVADQDFTRVLTANSGTCPTFNPANGQFTPGNCNSGNPTIGVITDAGIQALNSSALAFRRARWVQTTFACSDFPSEYRANPKPEGGGVLTSPWEVKDISMPFQDTTTVICANCHGSVNHLAPLFAYFDNSGIYRNTIQVTLPGGQLVAMMSDWLAPGQPLSWRRDAPAPTLTALAQAIAADPVFLTCVATRVWDWAMSKQDAIAEPAVPEDVIDPIRRAMKDDGNKVKAAIFAAFTSPDYIRY